MAKRRGVRGQGSINKRGKWWHVYYSIKGMPHRESARTQIRDEAVLYLQRKLGKIAAGEVIPPERVKISDLLDLVLKDYDLRERASSYIAGLKVNKYLLPAFGETKVINFRTAQLEAYIKQRQKEASTATINREISLLRRGFNLGFQADPPMVARVPHFPRLEEHNVRTGYLKPPQYKKLLIELPDELRLLFVFGYHVGVRKGALLRIRWEQVDLDAGFVYMEKKRSGKHVGRVLPIYGDMAAFIEMQPHDSEYLFARGSEPIKDFRCSWKAACKRAGVSGLLFHDLRRTAVRNMRRSGIPESLIMKITGHKTRAVFDRYNIIDEDDIREAGRKAASFLSSEESAQRGAQNQNQGKERFS